MPTPAHLRFAVLVFLTSALFILGVAPVHAQTEWTGGGDGTSWSDSANWSTGTVPGSGDAVVIDAQPGSDYVVTVDDNYEIASLVLNASQATLQLEGPLIVNSTAEHRAGRIDGPQTLTVGETLTWSNGIAAGEGVTDVGSLVLTSSAVKVLDGRQLVMRGGGQFVDGYNFHGRNGGELVIGGDATFDLSTTNNYRLFYYDGTGARPTITNQGRFRKIEGTTGRIDVDWALTNSRLLVLNQAGAHLNFRGPITDNDGTYRADAGRLDFSAVGETVTFGTNSRIAGAGIVDFSGGTFAVNGTVEVTGITEVSGASGQGASVTLPSTMTLTSWGDLSVRDRGTLDLQLTSLPALQDLALDFESTVQLAAPLTVQGTYTQVNATSTLRTSESVTVEGDFQWNGGTLTGGGVIEARGGLTLGGVGASSSNVKRLDNTRLVIAGGTTATHLGWYFFGGNGAVIEVQSGATLSVEGTQAFRPFQVLDGSSAAPTLDNQGTVEIVSPFEGLMGVDWALVNGGTVRVNQANAHLRFNGAVTDQEGRYEVPSGRLDFSAVGETFAFGAASVFEGGGVLEFSGGTITVNGTYNVTGTTEIAGAAGQGATVTFPSTMNLQSLGGTLLRVHDRASLDVQTSTLPAVGRLELGFQGRLTVAAPLQVTGGMALENASARFVSDQDLIVGGPLAWQGGYMEGGGTTIANGGITFTGGAGSASWNKGLRTGRTLVIPTGTTAEYVGTRNFDGSNGATIRIEEGALFDLQDWADLVEPSGSDFAPQIINNGTFRKSGGTSDSRIDWPITNSGVVEVGVDLLNLRERVTDQGGTYRTTAADAELRFQHRGEGFNFGEAATLSGPGTMHFYQEGVVSIFGTYDVTGRSKFSGNGTSLRADVTFEPGMNLVSLGALDIGTDFESGGIARIETPDPLTVPSLSLGGSGQLYLTPDLSVTGDASFGNAGTLLTGPSTLTVEGGLTWKGGTMAGTGRTLAAGPVRFTGGAGSASWNKVLDQRSFLLLPGVSATYEGTRNFTGENGALFYVQEGATLDIQQWADFVVSTGSDLQPILRNEGTVRKSGGDSDTQLFFDLENAGVLEVTNDVLALNGDITNTGRIQGTATLDVTNVSGSNNGIIAPGLSPGVLTVEGGLPFSSEAALEVEIGGTEVGTTYDQLVVTGPAMLGGTLDLSTINGYIPSGGEAFTILTAGEVQGQFDAVNQPADAMFDVQYTGTSVELVEATNGPPLASNDNAETLQETPVVIDVLANDTDPDGDPLQINSVTLPSNGKVAIVDAGIEYTPEPGFTGEDTFAYVVSDGRGGTDEATVIVTVTAATGTLAGTVFDNATEARIAGAQVQIPSLNLGTTTDSNGNYSFSEVPTGSYDVTASATGYRSDTRTAVVNAGETTTANFFLRVDDGLVRWTGGGDGSSWSDPSNWETGSVPTVEDVAMIDLNPEATFSVVVDADVAVGGLRVETVWATLQVDNRLDVTGGLGLAAGTIGGPDTLLVGGAVAFADGEISGTGTVVMDGGLTWTGGTMRGAGQTIVRGSSILHTEQGFENAGRPLYERTLTFADTVTVEQGFLDPRQGATVVVGSEAVVQFPDDRTGIRPLEYTSPRPRLENRGLIVKTGQGTSFYTSSLGYQEDTFRGDQSITIINTGVIRSEVGTMSVYVAEDTDVGGVVETTAAGRMNLYRARFSSTAQLGFSATVQGDGFFNFADAYRFTGTFDLAGTALLTGGQRFDESMTIRRANRLQLRTYRDEVFTFAAPNTPAIDTFLVRGLIDQQSDFTVTGLFGFGSEGAATLSGAGTITVGPDGEMGWGPGRLGGSGTIDVQGRLTAAVASYLAGDFRVQESEKWLDGRTMIVRGPATWDDATLNFDNGGVLDLREASVFDLQRDAAFQLGEGAVGDERMRLAGQFVKSGTGRRTSTGSEPVAYDDGFYDATVAVPTQNEGTFSIEAGTVALQNAILTNNGLVQGTDTLDVSESDSIFENQGTVGPGPASARFAVVGAFDNSAATLAIELAGTTAGETYDQLVVQGPATLGGELDVAVVDPFDPPGDTEYVILRAERLSGSFDTITLPTLDGRTVEVETTETDVRVRVVQTVTNSDPVAEDDAAQTTSGTSVLVDVLANDSDPDGDPLTISSVGSPEAGTAQIAEGGIQYDAPEGFTGDDSFPYQVSDGRGGVAQATVVITVRASNTAPVAENDADATETNTAIVIDVLANDRDPDGDPLSVVEVGAPSNGTAVIVDNGIEYTPADGFSGEDSFSYVVSDGRGGTDEASVTVSVGEPNGAPVATADSAETETNTSVVVHVLENDTDPDGDVLTVTDVGAPSNGEVRVESDGTVVRYSPAQDFEGEDVFSYTVSDGRGGTADATVTITVLPVNGAPVAEADSAVTEQGTAVRIEVLTNDTDPDGDTLRVLAVGSPENGTAQIEADVIVYTPNAGFVGTDAFSYTIVDEREATDEAIVTVRVERPNTPPDARDDAAVTVRDTPVTIPVLANDTDEDGDPLAVTITAEPTSGTAVRQDDQTVRYVPASGFTGADMFRYRVVDGRGGSDEAVVTVTVEGLRFTVTDVGTLGGEASRAVAINNEGVVVGLSLTDEGTVQSFRWRNGVMTPFGPAGFRPFALSDDGTAAGHVEQDSTVEATVLAGDGTLTRLGTLGGRNSAAYAINAIGDVVGTAQGRDGEYRAFRWTGTMAGLGRFGGEHSEAFALNRAEVAAGTVVRDGRHRAWMGNSLLEGSGESRVYDLNETGLAVGSGLVAETVVARLWRDGVVDDLGVGEGAWAEAYAVNDAGWVVGTTTESIGSDAATRQQKSMMATRFATAWRSSPSVSLLRGLQFGGEMRKQAVVNPEDLRAFLWIDGEIRDLNDFIPPDDGWTLLEARHLNNRGQIVGTGLLNGEERAFLLTPTDNAPPSADPDREMVASGRQHVIHVLDNDSDQDGDRLRLVSVSSPQLGHVEVASDSSALLYRSDERVQGTDVFSYVVSDGAGTTARGTVKLDVHIYVDPKSRPVLEPSAPNPVRSRTRIRYLLPKAESVRLEIFDVLGRRRAVLVDERQESGAKDVWLDVRRWAAGTYFCRLQVGETVQTHALTVVR